MGVYAHTSDCLKCTSCNERYQIDNAYPTQGIMQIIVMYRDRSACMFNIQIYTYEYIRVKSSASPIVTRNELPIMYAYVAAAGHCVVILSSPRARAVQYRDM